MHISQILNDAATAFHNIPTGFWQALIASGILSPLLKVFKHLFSIEAEKIMFAIVLFISVVVAFGAYLINKPTSNPSIIALHAAVLAFTTQPMYFYIVKPLWAYLSVKFGDAGAFANELKSAAIPAGGLPIDGTSVSSSSTKINDSTDFSK